LVALGDEVEIGQALGQVHMVSQPSWPPTVVQARTQGFVISLRAFPLTKQGECVAVIARPFVLPGGVVSAA
jgi:predicted deacylase